MIRQMERKLKKTIKTAADRKKDEPDLPSPANEEPLAEHAREISDNCQACDRCVKECGFLQKYGTPGSIAGKLQSNPAALLKTAFECSLCQMCTAVCPKSLQPHRLFLEMRRNAVRQNLINDPPQCMHVGFEKRGISPHLNYYALPKGCRAIFFPGCALSAAHPAVTLRLYQYLRKLNPGLGIVLDCCAKPSHDLGREQQFHLMFNEMCRYLVGNGVRRVIVPCPSCYKVFDEYGGALSVESVYEVLENETLPGFDDFRETVTVHDPCPFRFNCSVQSAVRTLLTRHGATIEEMPHHGEKTFCCGEGASVSCTSPTLAKNWSHRRVKETNGLKMVTYCAGCTSTLGKVADTTHILDLLFSPNDGHSAKKTIPGFPLTCWNRLRLKTIIKQWIPAAVSRERDIGPLLGQPIDIFSRNGWTWLISRFTAMVFSAANWFGKKKRPKWLDPN